MREKKAKANACARESVGCAGVMSVRFVLVIASEVSFLAVGGGKKERLGYGVEWHAELTLNTQSATGKAV